LDTWHKRRNNIKTDLREVISEDGWFYVAQDMISCVLFNCVHKGVVNSNS